MMNNVIFIHIMKCGGTSLLHMLYKQHGIEYFHPVTISTVTNIVSYPSLRGVTALEWQKQINPDTAKYYNVVAGHYDWEIAKRLQGWDVMVMMRHPVDQLRSLYQYMVRSKHELGNIVDWMLEIGFEGWIQSDHAKNYLNMQTTYLSGHHIRDKWVALDNLQNHRVTVGLVEQFGDSIKIFNQKFRWSLKEEHRLISKNVIALDEETYYLAMQLQHKDMALYTIAQAKFEQQLEEIM